jgi:hypothetical protein
MEDEGWNSHEKKDNSDSRDSSCYDDYYAGIGVSDNPINDSIAEIYKAIIKQEVTILVRKTLGKTYACVIAVTGRLHRQTKHLYRDYPELCRLCYAKQSEIIHRRVKLRSSIRPADVHQEKPTCYADQASYDWSLTKTLCYHKPVNIRYGQKGEVRGQQDRWLRQVVRRHSTEEMRAQPMSIYCPCSTWSLSTNFVHLDMDTIPSISISSIASVYTETAPKERKTSAIQRTSCLGFLSSCDSSWSTRVLLESISSLWKLIT